MGERVPRGPLSLSLTQFLSPEEDMSWRKLRIREGDGGYQAGSTGTAGKREREPASPAEEEVLFV